jgi:translation elongation factor EF-Ts
MKPNPVQIRDLRQRTGCSLLEAAHALESCECDRDLAAAWLRFNGCAISVKPKPGQSRAEAYAEWVLAKAREWLSEQAR